MLSYFLFPEADYRLALLFGIDRHFDTALHVEVILG